MAPLATRVTSRAALALAAALLPLAPAAPMPPGDPPAAGAPPPAAPAMRARLEAPLFSPAFAAFPVAAVEGEVVTLGEFTAALAATHEGRSEGAGASADAARAVLERLVDARLVTIEARAMGLDELPEVRDALRELEVAKLREAAELRAVRDVKPDAAEVERLYREAIRQWKIKSLLFRSEEEAKKLRAAVAAGKPFGELAAEALKRPDVQGKEEGEYYSGDKLLPQVFEAVRALGAGEVSGVVAIPAGAIVLEVQDVRYPDDPRARATAERIVRDAAWRRALKRHSAELLKRHASLDAKLLAALDFEAKRPGFEALAKDRRTLVRIRGEAPVTVADLAAALRKRFFHGMEAPSRDRKVNAAKAEVLDGLVSPRLFVKEARALRLDEEEGFRRAVEADRREALFGAFVQKVILPDLKVSEEEARRAYEERRAEYTYPTFYKLESLAFAKEEAARAARDRLAAGTDFKWLRANADGQVPEEARALDLDGRTLVEKALPPELTKALSGAKSGDVRVHATPEGQHVVVHVLEAVPPRSRPYEEVREEIGRKLGAEKLNAAVKDWVAKLRKAHAVDVYLTGVGS